MKITRRQLRNLISDAIDLDLQNGDVILTGRFKNKRQVVKDLGKDDLGQPTVNGMKALAFRVEKLMPKEKWSSKSKEEAEEVNEMKITRRQLRKIIGEQMGPGGLLPYDEDPTADEWYESRHADDQNDMDYYLAVALETAVQDNPGIGGRELVAIVKKDPLFQGITDDGVFDMMDQMLEEQTLWADWEEDAWYLANDTPHGRMN
jgi:hypothetical protein